MGAARIFLTMCTFERNDYFRDGPRAEQVRDQLLRIAFEFDVEIIAYVLMPDHVHILTAGLTDGADNLAYAERLRRCSAFHFKRTFASTLWQEGYDDRVLRNEEATLDVVRYIVFNPVRARLVSRPVEYPYLGSSRYNVDDLVTAAEWAR